MTFREDNNIPARKIETPYGVIWVWKPAAIRVPGGPDDLIQFEIDRTNRLVLASGATCYTDTPRYNNVRTYDVRWSRFTGFTAFNPTGVRNIVGRRNFKLDPVSEDADFLSNLFFQALLAGELPMGVVNEDFTLECQAKTNEYSARLRHLRQMKDELKNFVRIANQDVTQVLGRELFGDFKEPILSMKGYN
jgi:hypothetical protein